MSVIARRAVYAFAQKAFRPMFVGLPRPAVTCGGLTRFHQHDAKKGTPAHDHHHDHDHDHSHDHDHEHSQERSKAVEKKDGKAGEEATEELEELEEMFIEGPAGLEWGGPTRGGKRPEPTRYGDWERSGRVSDFK